MNLQVALKPGKQVELNIRNSEGQRLKLNTLIESGFDGEQLDVISPIHHGSYYTLHENDRLSLVFDVLADKNDRRKEVYEMEMRVASRRMVDDQLVVSLQRVSSPKKIQRRETYRLHLLKNVPYSYEGRSAEVLLKNISATGLRGIIEQKIPRGDSILVELDLEEGGPPLEIKAQVISCDLVAQSMLQYDLRLHFANISSHNKGLISHFINKKQLEALRKTRTPNEHSKAYELAYGYENNKRRGGDFIVQAVPILGLITWFISLSILALIVEARPEIRYNLDQFFNFYKRNYWQANLLRIAYFLAILEATICSIGLYMNSKRMKRAEDQYNRGLIFNLIFSALVICLYTLFPLIQ